MKKNAAGFEIVEFKLTGKALDHLSGMMSRANKEMKTGGRFLVMGQVRLDLNARGRYAGATLRCTYFNFEQFDIVQRAIKRALKVKK